MTLYIHQTTGTVHLHAECSIAKRDNRGRFKKKNRNRGMGADLRNLPTLRNCAKCL